MSVVKKPELKIIFLWLERKLKPEIMQRLKKNWPAIWGKIRERQTSLETTLEYILWQEKNCETVFQLSFRIQEVMDSLKNRGPQKHEFGQGLPKKYVLEIAEMLGLNVVSKTRKRQVLGLIIQRIAEKS